MPIYEFRCAMCGQEFQTFRSLGDTDPSDCPFCAVPLKRQFSAFAMKASFPEGYNPQVGKYVGSERQHKDELARLSERQTERTGILHDYQPVHPADARDVYGITDDGMDSTYRKEVETGKRETRLWL